MRKSKRMAAFAAAFSMTLLSGCSGMNIFDNYREVEDLEIVETIGIDKSKKGVAMVISSGTGLTGGSANIYKWEDETLAMATEHIQKLPEGKEAILSHAENILIGEEAAKDGITEYMDFVERAMELRLDTNLFIARGMSAEELISGASGENSSFSEMMRFLKANISTLGEGYVFSGRDTMQSMALRGCALVLAISGEKMEKHNEKESELAAVPVGFAMIKDGKLTGYLTDEETHGAVLLIEHIKEAPVTLEYGGGKVTVMISGIKTKFTPEFDDNGLVSRVDVKTELSAEVLSVPQGTELSDVAVRGELERLLEERERKSAEAVIKRTQEEGRDFLWIGGFIEREAPVKYAKMQKSWDEQYPGVEFSVSVEAELRRTYSIEDPINITGEETANSIWERLTKSVKGS